MEGNKFDYIKELLDKYDLKQNSKTGELRAYLKNRNKYVNLTNDKMTDLSFAYAWARAWVEAGYCDDNTKKKNNNSDLERKIPGFDKEGRELYEQFISVMKKWANGKDFHHYIDHYRMANLVQKGSQNPFAGRIVFQLLRPDRLDTKEEFHELYETGRMTTELVNQDDWLRRTYKFILNEADYTSSKGIQPGE